MPGAGNSKVNTAWTLSSGYKENQTKKRHSQPREIAAPRRWPRRSCLGGWRRGGELPGQGCAPVWKDEGELERELGVGSVPQDKLAGGRREREAFRKCKLFLAAGPQAVLRWGHWSWETHPASCLTQPAVHLAGLPRISHPGIDQKETWGDVHTRMFVRVSLSQQTSGKGLGAPP